MGTINLIESLDPESKKMLNSLVQSVLATQQDTEKERLEVLQVRRQLIKTQQQLEAERLDFERKKFELLKIVKARSQALDATKAVQRIATKRRKNVSVRRYKVEKDGA